MFKLIHIKTVSLLVLKGITIRLTVLFFALIFLISCKKFVQVSSPNSSVSSENVFENNSTAPAALTDLYATLSRGNVDLSGLGSNFFFSGLQADELTLYNSGSATYLSFYRNELSEANSVYDPYWGEKIYKYVFMCNSALEGLNKSTSLTPALKQQLLGETKFMRAFYYFYLVNFYGDVPLALTTDYKINTQLPRTSKDRVYDQILVDLQDAKSLLSEQYLSGDAITRSTDRYRPNKGVATALLARVYLYTKKYAEAEEQSTLLINNPDYDVSGVPLDQVFLTNSKETIWSLQSVGTSTRSNTGEGKVFVLTAIPATGWNCYLNRSLADSFETGDQRRDKWIDSINYNGNTYYFPYKYKIGEEVTPPTESSIVFRLAEQYLIRAEARLFQNDISGAQSDLNVVRNRAGLPNIAATDISSLTMAVQHERLVELFTEWSHRWFDLKRTQTIDQVMSAVTASKGGTWQPYQALMPIPQKEIEANPNLVGHQNPGY